MKVYFVRHGESKLNALQVHQHKAVALSDRGVRQARLLAQRLSRQPIDIVLASPYERARQTAEIIAAAQHKPIDFSPLVAELKRPSEIEGKHHDDPEAVRIKELLLENFHDRTWRYADEESFFDLRDRAIRSIAHIESLGRQNVLVVTHGGITTIIVAVMLYGPELSPHDFLRWQRFVHTDNTGITICELTPDQRWTLLAWNDHAHLECLEGAGIGT